MCKIPVHLQSIILGVIFKREYKNNKGKTLFCLKQTNFFDLWLVYTKLSHKCRSLPSTCKTTFKGKKFTS